MLKAKWVMVLASVLVLGGLAVWVLPERAEAAYGRRWVAERPPAPAAPASAEAALTPDEVEALALALDDEYKAWATYDQVIADLGDVSPFHRVIGAEETHIAALVTLYERYGLEVPTNPWPGSVPSFDSKADACAAGAEAETANAALYDQLLGMADNPDLVRVFTALQQASLTKHLPAFERCAP